MISNIFKSATEDSPEVILNASLRSFSVSGASILCFDDFYHPILEKLTRIFETLGKDEVFTIEIKLTHYHDPATKAFFIPLFENYIKYTKPPLSKNIVIKWYYDPNDPDMEM